LDGFEQSIGVFGDSSVANGETGQIFDYGQGLLQLHLADVGGGAVKLMSHFVWNAALVMAEYIEAGEVIDVRGRRGEGPPYIHARRVTEKKKLIITAYTAPYYWNHYNILTMDDAWIVIEFGAGAALPGLLCVKRGAQFVTLTDYPDPAIVHNLERNWYENLVETDDDKEARQATKQESIQTKIYTDITSSSESQQRQAMEKKVKCAVRGHAWGESAQAILDCLPTSNPPEQSQGYDWILLADTLWVSDGHAALLDSCCAVLDKSGKILVCCGLHTGYNTVKRFMTLAQSDSYGFQSELVEIRRIPTWGETRTSEELAQENALLKEEDIEHYSVEDRNRTVLMYVLSR
jgi:predicted nicotinamide N-methyase